MPRGFALVATVLLLVLVMLVALGLLQLSSISLRAGAREAVLAQARANARLSLMLAIGQLQQELGPDRRISAPSGLLDKTPSTPGTDGVSQPHWTGVWDAQDSPLVQGTLSQPAYDKKSSFRRWLVSGNSIDAQRIDAAVDGPSGEIFELVTEGSQQDIKRSVKVPVIRGSRDGIAWWTSDDGTKAVLRPGESPEIKSKAETLLAARRSNSDGHAAIDARFPTRGSGLDHRIVDLGTIDTAAPVEDTKERIAWKSIHDFTTLSETLPVDVTTGELRKCMNLRLDWLNSQTIAARKSEGTVGQIKNGDATKDYRLFSWDQLHNYESLARASSMVQINPATGRPYIRTFKQTGDAPESEWNPGCEEERFRIQPVLLKLGYVVSYGTEQLQNPANPTKSHALRLYLYPMVVLWNPYNVDLVVSEYCIHGWCPLTFELNKGTPNALTVNLAAKQAATMFAFGPQMGGNKIGDLVIPAGASRTLFSQPVNWQNKPSEHRNRFPYHYYMWADPGAFNLGPGNYGGVFKNLNSSAGMIDFNSRPLEEIWGAVDDTLRIAVSPSSSGLGSYTFGLRSAHTDWWGNNGPGDDTATALFRFSYSTNYEFRTEKDKTPQISLISDAEVPVRTFGNLVGKPQPLLYYEIFRKPANEDLFPMKSGSFSISGDPIHAQTGSDLGNTDFVTPWFESAYTFRFTAVNSWLDVLKTFQMPSNRDDRVYFGSSYSPSGQLNVVDQEIPLSPLVSLAQLQHLPLFDYRPSSKSFQQGRVTQFAQNHAIGNSYASPGIPSDKISFAGWKHRFADVESEHIRMDRTYIANAVLWDNWFCSSLGAQDGLMLTQDGSKLSAREVAEGVFNRTKPAPNDAVVARNELPSSALLDSLFTSGGLPAKDAYQKIAAHIRIQGGFNINSVSVEAWTHFLCGLLSRNQVVMESVSGSEAPAIVSQQKGQFLISRYSLGNASPAERVGSQERENRYWNGSREVTADQVRELATAIVVQVKKRGPFLSLAEFVNRRVSTNTELAVSGALQSALDDPSVSINAPFRSDNLTGSETTSAGKPSYAFAEASIGPRRQGITGYVTQADLLQSLGASITPRSDTFTIRAMGEARDHAGNVSVRVWCEAIVQREAAYVNPIEDTTTPQASLKQPANLRFGRRFEVVSFRWLNPNEI